MTQSERDSSVDKILEGLRKISEQYGPWTTNVDLGHGIYTRAEEDEDRRTRRLSLVQIGERGTLIASIQEPHCS